MKSRAWPTAMTRSGPSNTTRSTVARSRRPATRPGATTVPSASSQTRPVKVSSPTSTVTSGRGRSPSAGRGHGPFGHLDQGVVAPLGGGAGEVVEGGGVTEPAAGVGPVGLEQFGLDAVERTPDRGVAQRRELPVEQAGAVEAGGEVDPPVGVVVGGLGFDPVGLGELAPVGGGAGEAGPVQRAGVVDQQRLAVAEGIGELGPVERGEPAGRDAP